MESLLLQDGFMDMEEVQKWILPSDYDHTEAEAKHLVIIFVYRRR